MYWDGTKYCETHTEAYNNIVKNVIMPTPKKEDTKEKPKMDLGLKEKESKK